MYKKEKIIFTFLLLLCVQLCAAQGSRRDTAYFNYKWERATNNNYRYYQIMVADTVTMPPEKLIKITSYYKNGIKQMTGYVLASDITKRTGMYIYYEEKGRPVSIYLYDYKNSIKYFIKTGSYFKKIEPCDLDADLGISLYPDGHIKRSGFYLPGDEGASSHRKVCTWKHYNPYTESVAEITDYKYGEINGRHFRYHSNGKMWREEYYKDGKRTGTWKKYRFNGELRRKKVISRTVRT